MLPRGVCPSRQLGATGAGSQLTARTTVKLPRPLGKGDPARTLSLLMMHRSGSTGECAEIRAGETGGGAVDQGVGTGRGVVGDVDLRTDVGSKFRGVVGEVDRNACVALVVRDLG